MGGVGGPPAGGGRLRGREGGGWDEGRGVRWRSAYALVGGVGGFQRRRHHVLDCLVGFGDEVGGWEGGLAGWNGHWGGGLGGLEGEAEAYSFSSCRWRSLRGGRR